MPEQRKRLFLSQVHLKGYKSIDDLEITLNTGLNILIGKNGSGKSNFLSGLVEAMRSNWNSRVLFKSVSLTYTTDTNEVFKIIGEKANKNLNNSAQEYLDEDFYDIINVEQKLFMNDGKIYDNTDFDQPKSIIINNQRIFLRGNANSVLRRIGYNVPYPLFIKYNIPIDIPAVSDAATIDIEIDEDGEDMWPEIQTVTLLENMIYQLEKKYSGNQDSIRSLNRSKVLSALEVDEDILVNLKKFTPIKSIRLNENINVYVNDKGVIIENIKIEFFINNNWLPWSQLSDGTRRLFYIVTEITSRNGGLILLEEPELGVHPHQFSLIMDFILEQSIDNQIIVSTHSPLALNHLENSKLKNLILVSYDLKKGTLMRHLNKRELKKANAYITETGLLSDYWIHSDLE